MEIKEDMAIFFALSEADRVRITHELLNKIMFCEMKECVEKFPIKAELNETFLNYLKRLEFFKEISALHSRSRVIFKILNLESLKKKGKISTIIKNEEFQHESLL